MHALLLWAGAPAPTARGRGISGLAECTQPAQTGLLPPLSSPDFLSTPERPQLDPGRTHGNPRSPPGLLTLKPMLSHNHTVSPLESRQQKMLHTQPSRKPYSKRMLHSELNHLLAVGPQASYLTSVCLSCLICRLAITIISQCHCEA